MKNLMILSALGAGLYLATRSDELNEAPRGIRLNNPGNLEANGIPWDGLADEQPDTRFYKFTDPFYGIRAMARTLITYRRKHGLYTPLEIIERYAPHHENPVSEYAQFVADRAGISVTDPVTDNTLPEVVAAMIEFENGQNPYPQQFINRAIEAAKA